MMKLRLVLDTNVLISGLLSNNSNPQKVFDYAKAYACILISQETFQEIAQVLTRSKFDRYISLSRRAQFLHALINEAKMVEIIEKTTICRDPKDNKFLELAINGQADYLISGDQDLLILNPFHETKILLPQEFLSLGYSL